MAVAAEVNYLISVQHEVLQSGHPELAVTSDSKLYAAAMIRLPNGELTFDPDRLPMLMISNQAKGLHYQVVAIPRPEIVCIIFKGRDQDEKGTPLYLVKKLASTQRDFCNAYLAVANESDTGRKIATTFLESAASQ